MASHRSAAVGSAPTRALAVANARTPHSDLDALRSALISAFSTYGPIQLVAFPARGLLSLVVFECVEHAVNARAAMHQRPFPEGHGVSLSQHLAIRFADVRDAEKCAADEAVKRAHASGDGDSANASVDAADTDLSACTAFAGLPPPSTVTQCDSTCTDPVRM